MLILIPDAYDQFLATDDGKPVVMLNMLRLAPDGGRARYTGYLTAVTPIGARYGVEPIYFEDGLPALSAEAGQAWDAALLVRYPSRQAGHDGIDDDAGSLQLRGQLQVHRRLRRPPAAPVAAATAPGAEAAVALPEGDAQRLCSGCRSLSLVTAQRRPPEEWDATVARMETNGMVAPADDVYAVIDYLAKPCRPSERRSAWTRCNLAANLVSCRRSFRRIVRCRAF